MEKGKPRTVPPAPRRVIFFEGRGYFEHRQHWWVMDPAYRKWRNALYLEFAMEPPKK